jgi:hypothetical protein
MANRGKKKQPKVPSPPKPDQNQAEEQEEDDEEVLPQPAPVNAEDPDDPNDSKYHYDHVCLFYWDVTDQEIQDRTGPFFTDRISAISDFIYGVHHTTYRKAWPMKWRHTTYDIQYPVDETPRKVSLFLKCEKGRFPSLSG